MYTGGDRNWKDLPSELLGSIAEQLGAADYIRFGAVCTTWASVASLQDRIYLPLGRQLPYLLLLGEEGERGESGILARLPDRRYGRIAPLPEMRGMWCVGSQDGWLAVLDERSEVSLLNPLTRAQIQLPSVTTIPGVSPRYNSDGSFTEFLHTDRGETDPIPVTLAEFRCISFKKVVLSSRPTSGSYTAMAIFSLYNESVFAVSGAEKWTPLQTVPAFIDIIYRNGVFLAVSDNGQLWAINVSGPSPKTAMIAKGWGINCDDGYEKYLVDSSGDLLQVWMCDKTIKVMKFDPDHAAWVPLKSLGDNSLFLGLCYSISLSAREISDLKPNCIYFTEILWDWIQEGDNDRFKTRDVGVFNLEDGSFDRYHPPNSRLNWPPPLWFAPSFV